VKILVVAWSNPTSGEIHLFHVNQWQQMGHQVEIFPFDSEVTDEPGFRFLNSVEGCELEVGERRIAKACKKHRPDILLLFYHFISVSRMERLRRQCGCKVGFYLDNNHLLWRDTAQLMSAADFVAVHDRYVVPLVKGDRAGRNSNVYYVRGAAEPSEHRPMDLNEWDKLRYGCEIAVVGTAGPDRLQALSLLAEHKLKIWGTPEDWFACPVLSPCVSSEPVYGLKKIKVYNAASIIVNVEESARQIDTINPRICEVLACGGFVLANQTADLENAGFRDGESIAWFKSYEEMACKAAYYLANPDARRRVAQKGRELVLNTLTYEKISREWMHWMESVCDPSMNTH
jgi:hypothetical protein